MIYLLISKAEKENADQVCCCTYNVFRSKTTKVIHKFDNKVIKTKEKVFDVLIISLLSPEQSDGKATLLQSPCNKLYRSSIIEGNRIYFDQDLPYAEDWLFNVNFYRFAERVAFLPDCLYYYDRTTEASLSKKFRWNGFNDSVKIRKNEKEWFPEVCTNEVYCNLVLKIQKHYLNVYAHNIGLKGFTKYIKHLYENEDLRLVYSQLDVIEKEYKPAKTAFDKESFRKYKFWSYKISFAGLLKHYVKKVISR